MKSRRWLIAGAFFAGIWVFVRGAALTPVSLFTNFLVGLAVGLPVAYVFRRLHEEEIDITRSVGTLPFVVRYVLVFLQEIIVANFDVAYRVLAVRPRIDPQVILVPLRVQTALGITTIANSITLTPGTVTLDHDPDENALYIHTVDGRDPDAIVRPIRVWENYALTIFDEERSPDDPPPEIRVHPPDHPPEPKTVRGAIKTPADVEDPADVVGSADVEDPADVGDPAAGEEAPEPAESDTGGDDDDR